MCLGTSKNPENKNMSEPWDERTKRTFMLTQASTTDFCWIADCLRRSQSSTERLGQRTHLFGSLWGTEVLGWALIVSLASLAFYVIKAEELPLTSIGVRKASSFRQQRDGSSNDDIQPESHI